MKYLSKKEFVTKNEKDFFPCKKDGTKLNILEKIGFVAVNIVILLGYVAFRMLIGVVIVAFMCAVTLHGFFPKSMDTAEAFLIAIRDVRVISFGVVVGCFFWFGEN